MILWFYVGTYRLLFKIEETKLSSFHIKGVDMSRTKFKYLAKLGVNEIDIIPLEVINLICVENRGKINKRTCKRCIINWS